MNNTTLCSTNDCEKLSNLTSIVKRPTMDLTSLILSLGGSLGILPNLIIVLGVYYKRSLRKPTYYLLANLALCDMLLSSASISNVIIIALSQQNKISYEVRVILCKILGIFPLYLSYSASVQTLIIISGERYQAIFRPTSQLTARKAKYLCLMAWIISAFISFPFIITTTASNSPSKHCSGFTTYTNWTTVIYLLLFVFQFVLPTVIMATLYSLILHQLKKTIPGQHESRRSRNLKRKIIYMLLTTTTIFLVFAAPWATSIAIMAITKTLPEEIINHPAYPVLSQIVRISRPMLAFTAIYNPIIYCIFNSHIRHLYWSCCSYFICRNKAVVPTIQTNSKVGHASTTNSDTDKEIKNRYIKTNYLTVPISSS